MNIGGVTVLGNVGSMLDRAVRAYLMSVNVQSLGPIFAANNAFVKSYPCLIVQSVRSTSDQVQNYYDLQLRAEMTVATEAEPENPEANRVTLDNLIGAALYAMLQSNDSFTLDYAAGLITAAGQALAAAPVIANEPSTTYIAANNQDMVNFTCQHLEYKGDTRAEPDQGGASWVEIRHFKAQVLPVTIVL